MNIEYNVILEFAKYWKLLFPLAASILIAILFYRLNKIFILGLTKSSSFPNLIKFLEKKFLPLSIHIFLLISVSVTAATLSHFVEDLFLFSSVIKFIALLLFLKFIKIFLESPFLSKVSAIILIPTLFLNIFGLLDSVINSLNQDDYSVSIGSFKITLYTAIKAFLITFIVFRLSLVVSQKTKDYIGNRESIQSNVRGLLQKLIDIIIYLILFFVILQLLGVDLTAFAFIGGAVGVGIGFGLQKIASNFISGIVLLFERSVEMGDLVELESGNILGTVTRFSGRYTLIETLDGKEIMVPNEEFIINKVTNLTYKTNRGRIDIKIGISYDSDIKKARDIMIKAAKDHPRCLVYPNVECYVDNFGDNAVEFILFFWIGNVSEGRIKPKSDVMITIWEEFKKNNILIPFPQRDINFKSPIIISSKHPSSKI